MDGDEAEHSPHGPTFGGFWLGRKSPRGTAAEFHKGAVAAPLGGAHAAWQTGASPWITVHHRQKSIRPFPLCSAV